MFMLSQRVGGGAIPIEHRTLNGPQRAGKKSESVVFPDGSHIR